MYARVFRSFEETSGGLWRCKHCPYTIQKRDLDAMFDHLTTAHWRSSKPKSSILISQNHNEIDDNSSMNPSTDTQQEINNVSKDITTHLMHEDLPNTSKTIGPDRPRLLSDLGKDYEAGRPLLKNKSSLGGVTIDANSVKQPKVKIHLPNGHEIEGFVLGSIYDPKNCAKNKDVVNLANNCVNDEVRTAGSPILLEKPSSSNLQKIIEETIEQTFRNNESDSRILPRDDMRKSDFPYSRESDTNYPRQTKVQRTFTTMETYQSTGNDSGRMVEEIPEPVEEEVQIIMQNIPSLTADVQANKNGLTSMSYEYIKTEKAGEKKNVAVITLNRPKALNALCNKLLDELGDAVTKFDGDDGIGAIIITGSEMAFAAGTDIKEVANQTHAQAIKEHVLGNWNGILRASKPMIAAVNGYALGGGCELAMMCDIIYAGEKAHFGQPEIVIGTIPRAGGTQRLTRVVGKSKAMEMMLTGNHISAVEAEKSGLVSKVFPPEELLSEAIKLGERISTHSQLIVSMAKEAVNSAYETKLQEGLRLEKKIYYGTLATADRKEGMAAFIEKRAPKFINE